MTRGAALALAALALGGCGGEEAAGDLRWERQPKVFGAGGEHVAAGKVKNDSGRRIRLVAEDVELLDADGDRVPGTALFLQAFTKRLHPPDRQPADVSDFELRRTGRIAVIEPGKSLPLTIGWRQARGGDPPERIDYGSGSLPIPAEPGR